MKEVLCLNQISLLVKISSVLLLSYTSSNTRPEQFSEKVFNECLGVSNSPEANFGYLMLMSTERRLSWSEENFWTKHFLGTITFQMFNLCLTVYFENVFHDKSQTGSLRCLHTGRELPIALFFKTFIPKKTTTLTFFLIFLACSFTVNYSEIQPC